MKKIEEWFLTDIVDQAGQPDGSAFVDHHVLRLGLELGEDDDDLLLLAVAVAPVQILVVVIAVQVVVVVSVRLA